MKVLIGTYLHKVKYYCIEDWFKNVKKMMEKFPEADLLVVDNSDEKNSPAWLRLKMDSIFGKNKQTMMWIDTIGKNSRFKQTESQKVLWNYALENKYEKLFIIESDVFPKDVNTIKKLYDADKPIVSGVFPLWVDEKDKANDVLCIMGYGLNADLKRFWYHRFLFDRAIEKVGRDSLIKIYACGLGCVMIDREVLENIKPEYATQKVVDDLMKILFKVDKMKKSNLKKWLQIKLKGLIISEEKMVKEKIHPDTNFFMHCELYNVSRYMLPSIDCDHKRSEWSEIEKIVPR